MCGTCQLPTRQPLSGSKPVVLSIDGVVLKIVRGREDLFRAIKVAAGGDTLQPVAALLSLSIRTFTWVVRADAEVARNVRSKRNRGALKDRRNGTIGRVRG